MRTASRAASARDEEAPMARDLLAMSEGLIDGTLSIEDHHPVSISTGTTPLDLGDGLAFLESFANVSAIRSGGELGVIDAGGVIHAASVHEALRSWTSDPLRIAVYTHGHVDHCFGVPHFEAEHGAPAVRVVAHEAVPDRFDRYRLTAGYNGHINMRQFRLGAPLFPTEFRYPDETYRDRLDIRVGDVAVELRHDRGETDDHTWAWIPSRRVLCTGDLFIWAAPNCGNPQKAQRYPVDWAAALRKMEALDPEVLLPGHGLPIVGADRVRRALADTAELLESISSQCLEMMNAGARLDDLVHGVEVPADLLDRPWLRPVYDDPEFIVHTMWRLYGGWWDGNPATLKPARDAVLAAEVAALAGGAHVLARRAGELLTEGRLREAGHLAEMAALAAPGDAAVHGVRAEVNRARVAAESSLMAKGIFGWAESQSEAARAAASAAARPKGESPS
jgi:glyoxylase-like metal-dependent hydrolase (beta-lactamase superfamily II)